MVVIRDGKVLVVRAYAARNRGDLMLPGGRVEPGETHAAAAVRETREETGIVVTDSMPVWERRDEGEDVRVFFAVAWEGDVRGSLEGRARWKDPGWLVARRGDGNSNDRQTGDVIAYLRECGMV